MFALRPGWLALALFVWAIGIFLGSTYDNQNTSATWAGSGTGSGQVAPSETLQNMGQGTEATQQNAIAGVIKIVFNGNFWESVYRIVFWHFSFMYDTSGNFVGGMFYWIFMFPFVAMGLLSILILGWSILRGNISFG